jgi:hypothetical protein
VHAPVEDKDDTVESFFYDTLDTVYRTIPKHNAIIDMGDMNAKIVEDALTPCTGKYRLYKIPDYSVERLCDFATCRKFFTVSVIFPLKNIQLRIWISPD